MKPFIIVLLIAAGIITISWFGYSKLAATSAENAAKLAAEDLPLPVAETPEVAPAVVTPPAATPTVVSTAPVVTPAEPVVTPTPAPVTRKPGTYTIADVAKHNSKADCWTAVNGRVYNVTNYDKKHPGGSKEMLRTCGIDATSAFNGQHGGQKKPEQVLAGFKIGVLVK